MAFPSKLVGLLLVLGILSSGCVGMTMDEDAAVSRGRSATKDNNYTVQKLTPELVAKLAQQSNKVVTDKDPSAGAKPTPYTVGPFDVLQITVWEHPELTTPAGAAASLVLSADPSGGPPPGLSGAGNANGIGVDANGTIFYPHVGVLDVNGKTLAEIRAVLTERLARVIVNPQLDVRVATFRAKRIQIAGEVLTPTTVPLTDVPLRLQDAIAAARGLTPESPLGTQGFGPDLSRVTLTRGDKTYHIDLLALYETGDTSQNWLLQDGDVVHVGDRGRNRVFILGEVRNPAARLMAKRRMTLAEALTDTGGFEPPAANVDKIYVIRGDMRAPEIYRLDAHSADAMILATQFQMRPLDIVYVSTYNITRWSRTMTQILPTVQLLYEAVVGGAVLRNLFKSE